VKKLFFQILLITLFCLLYSMNMTPLPRLMCQHTLCLSSYVTSDFDLASGVWRLFLSGPPPGSSLSGAWAATPPPSTFQLASTTDPGAECSETAWPPGSFPLPGSAGVPPPPVGQPCKIWGRGSSCHRLKTSFRTTISRLADNWTFYYLFVKTCRVKSRKVYF